MSVADVEQQRTLALAIVTHELKTPLTALKGNLQLSQRRLADLQPGESGQSANAHRELERLLGSSLKQVARLSQQVEDLLDDSSLQEGRFLTELAPCDLRDIVRQGVEDLRASACGSRSIHLHMDLAPVTVSADAGRIGQVVANFLSNALKYAAHETPITVSLAQEEGCGRVSVRDEGPGISPSEQPSVWQRFYRVPGAGHGTARGLGLGLAICRAIILQHGGQVGLESQPGLGSTFWFTLPLLACNACAALAD